MPRLLQVVRRSEAGQSLVELALVLPICLWIVLGIVDFGRVYYLYVVTTNAAREGARYWASHPGDSVATIQSKVQAEASPQVTITSGQITLSNPTVDQYRVQVQLSFTPITPVIATAWGGGALTITTSAVMPKLTDT